MTDMSPEKSPSGREIVPIFVPGEQRCLPPRAEAKKAGAASEVTRRIPRPPCLIGIEACNYLSPNYLPFVLEQP